MSRCPACKWYVFGCYFPLPLLIRVEQLRHDAQITLEALDHSSISEDPFQYVFLHDHRDVFGRYDVVIRYASIRQCTTRHNLINGIEWTCPLRKCATNLLI